MARKLIPLAISYDFDGTLAPGNMQEHGFLPAVGVPKKKFWREVTALSKQHRGDNILIYMGLMLEKAQASHTPVRRSDFRALGRQVKLFHGVETWFKRISAYGRQRGVKVDHYLISSGLREIVEGTKIHRHFKEMYASTFWYSHNGIAMWPALALNYTTKTQYLFRINKGNLLVYDHSKINDYVPQSDRPVPFQNMVFIGDGETDIPCFRLIKDQGGHSIAVYKPHTAKARAASKKLKRDGRIHFLAPADYAAGKSLERIVMSVIDKIVADARLAEFGK